VDTAAPNKTKPRRQQTAMAEGNISRGGYNRPAMQFTGDGGDHFVLTTNGPRTKELDNDNFTFSSSSSSERDDVSSELASSLQETNIQNENIIQQLLSRLTIIETQLQSQRKSIEAEINEWKEKHSLVAKALHRFSSHGKETKDPPAQSADSKYRHEQLRRQNCEILDKIGRLTYENGQLLAKCHIHEEDEYQYENLLVFAEELQEENDEIHDRMSGISDKLVDFTQAREDYIQCYEAQLASLKVEKNQAELSKEELNTMLLGELKEQKEEVRKMKMANKEAYKTCEVMHQKIVLLHEALEESNASDEIGSVENKARNDREVKLATLMLKRVSWANGNCPRTHQQYEDDDDEERDSISRDSISRDTISRDSISNMTDSFSWQYLL
jgi:hypothetical protein